MKYEIVQGGKLNKAPTQPSFAPQPQQAPQDAGEGPGLLGRLGLSAVRGLEAPGHAVDALLQLIGEPKLMQGSLSGDITRKLGYTQEQFAPQSIPESYAQRFLGQAPTAIALGPLDALKSLAIGTGAATGLEAAGAPEWAQDIGQLGTEIGYGALQGKIPSWKSKQQEAYAEARGYVPEKTKIQAPAIEAGIGKAREALKTEASEKISKKVEHAIGTVENNLEKLWQKKDRAINPKTALELRKKLYRDVKNLPKDAYEYSKILTDSLNDFFAQYSAQNPKFYNSLQKADKITQLKNMNSYLADVVGKLSSVVVPAELGGIKTQALTKKFFNHAIGNTVGEVDKIARRIINDPKIAGKHYLDVVKAASNPPLFIKKLTEFDQMMAAEDAGIPLIAEKPKSSIKYELVSGKKIA